MKLYYTLSLIYSHHVLEAVIMEIAYVESII